MIHTTRWLSVRVYHSVKRFISQNTNPELQRIQGVNDLPTEREHCLFMAVTWYASFVIWFMWNSSQIRVNLVSADALLIVKAISENLWITKS